jgi:hypothetical protein
VALVGVAIMIKTSVTLSTRMVLISEGNSLFQANESTETGFADELR